MLHRWRERERFIEQVKGDRITPDELKHQLESGERVVIIDLRHPLDVLTDPRTLPGALADRARRSDERVTARSRATARSSSSVLDQTKPPAPVWRCNSGRSEFVACARCWAAFTNGRVWAFRWWTFRSQANSSRPGTHLLPPKAQRKEAVVGSRLIASPTMCHPAALSHETCHPERRSP